MVQIHYTIAQKISVITWKARFLCHAVNWYNLLALAQQQKATTNNPAKNSSIVKMVK